MRHICLLFSIIALFLSSVLMTSCNMKGSRITICYDEHAKEEKDTLKETTHDSKATADSINDVSANKALKEHIVYYLDYSGSMENAPHEGLFKKVKNSLIESISNIKGEDVEIEVIPFLDERIWDPQRVFSITKGKKFDENKLKELCDSIREIKALNKDSEGKWFETHHDIVIKDFLERRINNAKQYHLMVLLTDGEDYSKKGAANVLKESWLEKTRGKYVFGVYCDLQDGGSKKELAECFKNESYNRLFYKTDLNLDFDVSILANDDVTINRRQKNTVEVAIGGKIPKFTKPTYKDDYYEYTLTQPDNAKYIEFRVDPLDPAKKLPNSWDFKFKLEYENPTHTHYLSATEINLCVIDEKTPIVKFWLPCKTKGTGNCVSQEIGFCKKLFSLPPEWSDTITIKIPYEKSDDAKDKNEFNGLQLSISDLSDYVKVVGDSEVLLNKASDTVSFTLTIDPTSEAREDGKTISGKIMLTGADELKEIFINDTPLKEVESSNQLSLLEITTEKRLHPLIWLIISLIALYLLVCCIVWVHGICSLRFPEKGIFVVEPIGTNPNIQFVGIKSHNGEVIVPMALSDRINSDILNKYHIKEIIVRNNNPAPGMYCWDKKQSYWDKKWNGETILINGDFRHHPISYLEIKPSGSIRETGIEIKVFDNVGTLSNTVTVPIYEITPNNHDTGYQYLLPATIQVKGVAPYRVGN